MHISLVARILWTTGISVESALLLTLLLKGRWKVFRFFAVWIAFRTASDVTGFFVLSYASATIYKVFYWASQVGDLVLQICVIYEIASIVLKPTGAWIRDALKTFLSLSIAGVAVALALSYVAHPHSPTSLDAWIERGSLFSAMLSLELFIAMGAASTNLGLVWRNHVMGLAVGWSIWAIVDFFTEGAYTYLGPNWNGIAFDQIRIITSQLVTIYWAIIFWLPEPEGRTLSPQMRAYLSALHQEVQLSARRASSLNHR